MRFLLLLTLFLFSLYAQNVPDLYKQLSEPLADALAPLEQLEDLQTLQKPIEEYREELELILVQGQEAQESKDASQKKEYLKALRGLQKKYDYLLHLLHTEVHRAIDTNDYKLFVRLTSYEFPFYLKSKTISEKAFSYYQANKTQHKSVVLEKMARVRDGIKNAEHYNAKLEYATYDSQREVSTKHSVVVQGVKSKNSVLIYIANKNPYTVTVGFKGIYENLSPETLVSETIVLQPNSKQLYAKLLPREKNKSYSYKYRYRWIIGSKDSVHDDTYIYRLPYQLGNSHLVTQGYNGKFTHFGQSQYAIDFAMDIGTKLYAARSGVVVRTKSDSNRVGTTEEFAKDGNFVTIEHDDRTFATYYHLKQNGVKVKVGERVSQGTFIGYSGNTGYSTGPHLHFAVFQTTRDGSAVESIPIRFSSKQGTIEKPLEGKYYTAK